MKLIGIAGGTGSGKSTLAWNIVEHLGKDQAVVLSHDSYYRDQAHMSQEERDAVNYDHPDSLETDLLVNQLKALKNGETVQVPVYDFANDTRDLTQTSKVGPRPYILVEGILILSEPALMGLFDLSVFVDVPADTRLIRRLRRDVKTRGRTWQYTVDSWEKFAQPMHNQFVEPSKHLADVIVPEGGKNQAGIHKVLELIK